MEYLLISGAPNVGKTETIHRLTQELIASGFIVIAGNFPPIQRNDFHCVLEGSNNEGKTIRIIINTPSDNERLIKKFKKFYDTNAIVGKYDIFISSIRDEGFYPRQEFLDIMNMPDDFLEIPLAKITRRTTEDKNGNKKYNRIIALQWYRNKIDKLIKHTLNLPPYNLNY